MITLEQFQVCTGTTATRATRARAEARYPSYVDAFTLFGIDSTAQQVMLLANIGHECGGFFYSAEIWGPTRQQRRYERDFSAPWPEDDKEAALPEFATNRLAYRLGNYVAGDGLKFRGQGDLQITGRFNAARVAAELRERFPELEVPDFEQYPGQLCAPRWAALIACHYWVSRECGRYADAGDFDSACDLINYGRTTASLGDSNGYAGRLALLRAGAAATGLQLAKDYQ